MGFLLVNDGQAGCSSISADLINEQRFTFVLFADYNLIYCLFHRYFVESVKFVLTFKKLSGIIQVLQMYHCRKLYHIFEGDFIMKLKRVSRGLTAFAVTAASLTCLADIPASAASGAGGLTWEKTQGYHEGTDSVTDGNESTTVRFTDADNEEHVAGFCAQDGTGWDWSDYTQFCFTVSNGSASDISFEIALGTGADWSWHQTTNNAVIGAGESVDLTYYLKSEEWTYDGTVCGIADLYQVHRINMMVMPAAKNTTVSGEITISDMKLGGSSSSEVTAKDGFYVDGAVLRDANQNPFVMRGTNYAYTWYSWEGNAEATLKEIAGYGANVVRIVLGDGEKYTKNSSGEIANLISLCEKYHLVAVFEVHDATGSNDANTLLTAAKYFANDLTSALKGHEDTVIINIANEWQGSANDAAWQSAHIDAVKIIRDAGLTHCIMCDAGGWGQTASTVINGGAAVLAADPEHNVMFSVHMYGYAGGTKERIKNIMDSMITRELCLVIGEFGFTHSDGDVDEAYIMSYAEETGTGWMAWSWYGNGSPVEYLDMSSKNVGGTLSADWGEVVVNGPNGWKATANPCTVFLDVQPVVTTVTEQTTTILTFTETTTASASSVWESETTAPGFQVIRGDADCNQTVNVLDAVVIARMVGEDATLETSAESKANAELDGNSGVTVADLSILLSFLAKQIDVL